MKVNVEDVSSVKKVLHIEIPQETVVSELDSAYRDVKKNAKVKGFRPGKAPRSVLERLYKKDVQADVSSKLIQTSFTEAIRETDLKIISSPKIDPPELNAGSSYAYDAAVDVKPELEDLDIKGLALKRTKYEVGNEELDAQLGMLQKNMAKKVKIEEDRPVQTDDFVVIDYEGFKNGKPYDETSKTENFTMKIGDAQITKDFDDNLIGKKAGDIVDFDVTFPEDYHNEKLKSLTIQFHVTLSEIRKEELPELDDDFAKSLGQFETLENLKNVIKDNLTQGYEKRIEQELNEQIFKNILGKVDFELPESMIEYELENIIADTERRLAYQNTSMEKVGLSKEKLQEQYRETAEQQVRRQIILGKVIEQEKLELTDEEMDVGYAEMAQNFNQPVDQIKGFYDQNKDRLDFFKHALLEKKAIKLIIDYGNIEDVEPEKVAAAGDKDTEPKETTGE
jgi:trigger factor